MKLFRLVIPVLAGLAMAVGTLTAFAHSKAAPTSPPGPIALETDLTSAAGPEGTNGPENMHADAQGRLWISQDADGAAYIRVFDPATRVYTDYTGLVSPNDAQLGPDGNLWWNPDTPFQAAGLARMDLASRIVTTWSVPSLSCGSSLAFDSNNQVWALDCGAASLFSFAPNSNQLCTLALPNGSGGTLLTEQNGALWLGLDDVVSPGLARITPTAGITVNYTFWPVNIGGFMATPSGVSFAPNGVVWFADEVSGTIGRLEPGANRVTLFSAPGGFAPQQVDYFLGKVWFTGLNENNGTGSVGYLDPATATGTAPQVVAPTNAMLPPVCVDAGAGLTSTVGIRTGVSVFRPLTLTASGDAQGISYATPISSQPAALVRFGSNLWLTDQGRNTLVEFVISPTIVSLPLVRK